MLLYLINLLITDPLKFLLAILLLILPLLISIALHEWAHGFIAYKLGDSTPKAYGRLTLNPIKHLDLIGTIMLFVVGIGWAKPVPISPENLKSKFKIALVGAAGPLSNISLAVIFSFVSVILSKYLNNNSLEFFFLMSTLVVRINLILTVFNLMPIPPLDGSRILSWILPEKINKFYVKLEPYGMAIILILAFTIGFKHIYSIAVIMQNKLFNIINLII